MLWRVGPGGKRTNSGLLLTGGEGYWFCHWLDVFSSSWNLSEVSNTRLAKLHLSFWKLQKLVTFAIGFHDRQSELCRLDYNERRSILKGYSYRHSFSRMNNSDISATDWPTNNAKNRHTHTQRKGRTFLYAVKGTCPRPPGPWGQPERSPGPWSPPAPQGRRPGRGSSLGHSVAVPVPSLAAWLTLGPTRHLACAQLPPGQRHPRAVKTGPLSLAAASLLPLPWPCSWGPRLTFHKDQWQIQGFGHETHRGKQGALLAASFVSEAEKQPCSWDHTYIPTWLTNIFPGADLG